MRKNAFENFGFSVQRPLDPITKHIEQTLHSVYVNPPRHQHLPWTSGLTASTNHITAEMRRRRVLPRWRHRRSCEPLCRSCLTSARLSVGTHRSCPLGPPRRCGLRNEQREGGQIDAGGETDGGKGNVRVKSRWTKRANKDYY